MSFRRRHPSSSVCHQASNTITSIATSWSSSSRPGSRLSCLPAIPRALMHASHQVRCWACPDSNMVFDFKLGRSTSDRNNIGSLNFNRFITQCFHATISLSLGMSFRLGMTIAQEGSCEPYPRLPSDLLPSRVSKPPRLLFRMHRA